MRYQPITACRSVQIARLYGCDNIARSMLSPCPPPLQLKAKMRPLRRFTKFPRCCKAFVDVQLRMPSFVQRSPLCKAPEPLAKIALPLILPKPGLIFRRFSAESGLCPHSIITPTKG